MRLSIHDLAGRRILERETFVPAGPQALRWDGLDAAGRPVAAGVYVYRLRTAGGEGIGRMTLVK